MVNHTRLVTGDVGSYSAQGKFSFKYLFIKIGIFGVYRVRVSLVLSVSVRLFLAS